MSRLQAKQDSERRYWLLKMLMVGSIVLYLATSMLEHFVLEKFNLNYNCEGRLVNSLANKNSDVEQVLLKITSKDKDVKIKVSYRKNQLEWSFIKLKGNLTEVHPSTMDYKIELHEDNYLYSELAPDLPLFLKLMTERISKTINEKGKMVLDLHVLKVDFESQSMLLQITPSRNLWVCQLEHVAGNKSPWNIF